MGGSSCRPWSPGETDPERLADLTSGRLKATRAQLVEALHGRVTDHHRFMLRLHLTHIGALDAAIPEVEARIREALTPFSCSGQSPDDDAGRE